MLSPFDQSGEFFVARVNPSAELIGYGWVVGVLEDFLLEGGDVEGLDPYVEDETDEGIELLLGEVDVHLVYAVLGVSDILFKETIGCFLCDEHALVDAIGVAVANGPYSGRA